MRRVVNEGLQICIYAKKEKWKKITQEMQISPKRVIISLFQIQSITHFFLTLATTSTIRAEVVMALLTQTL